LFALKNADAKGIVPENQISSRPQKNAADPSIAPCAPPLREKEEEKEAPYADAETQKKAHPKCNSMVHRGQEDCQYKEKLTLTIVLFNSRVGLE